MPEPRLSEAAITRSIRMLLKTLGVLHWKQHQGLGSTPGVPDIIGIWQGKMLGIEVKTAKGKLSVQQQLFLDAIRREGGMKMNPTLAAEGDA